jgi:hypothetical protein
MLGCRTPSVFSCEDATDCKTNGEQGMCEATGWCSFEDDACLSGRRYGAFAPAELQNQCVEPVAAGTGSTTMEPTTSVETSGASGATSTGTSTGTTTLAPTSDGDSSTGETRCAVAFTDDFDDTVPDARWDPFDDPGVSVAETDGVLVVSIEAAVTDGWGGYSTAEAYALTNAELSVELVAATQQPDTESGFTITDAATGDEVGIAVASGQLVALHYDVAQDIFQTLASIPYEPNAHRFLRIRTDSETSMIKFEYGSDERSWQELGTASTDIVALDPAVVELSAGHDTDSALDAPTVTQFDNFSMCAG